MQNYDRALAYAKQRGVEIPNIESFKKYTTDDLKSALKQHGVAFKTKARKEELAKQLIVAQLMPQLTEAQRHRLRHKSDVGKTLRDRRQRKMVAKVARAGRLAKLYGG